MPSYTDGFTGTEIVSRVKDYIGRYTDKFQGFMEKSLPLAEMRFCKMHDWRFLRKAGLTLATNYGQAEYDLTPANLKDGSDGYYMSTTNVETIYSPDGQIVLKRVNLDELRRYDPNLDDGSTSDYPTLWAAISDTKIRIWPPKFSGVTLQIDGKVTPPLPGKDLFANLDNYPSIPVRYQESFIEYVTAIALDFEDDARAAAKKKEAVALIKEDIKDDLRNLGNTTNDRIKSLYEQRFDGKSTNLDRYLWGLWDYDWE